MSTKTWFYHGRHKKVSQKYFIMVSSSLMVQLSSTFHWTNQHVYHSVKCCVTGAFIHSTPCCGYCSWLSWLVMVKTNLYQYLSDSSFSYTNCCFKIRDIKVQTRCNEIEAAPERHRCTDVVPNTDFHKNQTHIISYEVALTELKKNAFLWKAHEKPVLVNANYVTFYKPHWITACHIDLPTRVLQQVSASTYFVPYIKPSNIKPSLLHFGLFLHVQQSRFLLSGALAAETYNCCALAIVCLTLH